MTNETEDGDAMDARRFAALAAAYGSSPGRWPDAERKAAASFAASEAGRAILRRAAALDGLLDIHSVRPAGAALHGAVLATAGRDLRQQRRRRSWWLGLGLAGIGLAGAVAGLGLVTVVLPGAQPDSYLLDTNATAFGDALPDAENGEESL